MERIVQRNIVDVNGCCIYGPLPADGGGIISMFSWLIQVKLLESDNQDFLPSDVSLASSWVSSCLVSFTKRIS